MAAAIPNVHNRSAQRRLICAWARWLAAVWLCLLAGRVWAQARPSEYDVKAAYLLNFGKFMRVNGGQQPQGTFNICILGRDPMGAVMDQTAANETIDGLPVRVRRMNDPTQARACQIVYISPAEAGRMRENLAILAGTDALTVSGDPEFLDLGGMIEFILQGDHVRFSVNLNAVDHTHIVLSSELLRVAAAVEGRPKRGGGR